MPAPTHNRTGLNEGRAMDAELLDPTFDDLDPWDLPEAPEEDLR